MTGHEANAVLKYFAPLDDFIKIRVFTSREISDLLRHTRIDSKKHFVQLVINACVIGYHSDVLPRLAGAEEALYELCTQVNPDLHHGRVTLEATQEVPELLLLEAESQRPAPARDIESELGRRVIGQPTAVTLVARAVKKGLAGLRDPNRPIATFLFLGQTGVGKTELAKALTDALYHDPSQMVRVDCSEFALPHEYAKLIGAPPGYIGHDQGGVLTEALRQSSDRVVLFDEVEKSDGKVHDLLLQIIDEGFLTDGKGRRVLASRAILVLTSNVGAAELEGLRRRIGFRPGQATEAAVSETLSDALREKFRPEFINRLSEIVVFNPIGLTECELISARMLDDVRRHAEQIPLRLEFSPPVARFVARKGYVPEFGARELRRTVEREIEAPLSEMIVDGDLKAGDRVQVRVRRDRLQFHRN